MFGAADDSNDDNSTLWKVIAGIVIFVCIVGVVIYFKDDIDMIDTSLASEAEAKGLAKLGKIAKITFTKTTPNATEDDVARQQNTFQINELFIYDNTPAMLKRADFESVAFNMVTNEHYEKYFNAWNVIDGDNETFASSEGPEVSHILTMKLKTPTVLSKVEILNRKLYEARLTGTVLRLYDTAGKVVYEKILEPKLTQVFTE